MVKDIKASSEAQIYISRLIRLANLAEQEQVFSWDFNPLPLMGIAVPRGFNGLKDSIKSITDDSQIKIKHVSYMAHQRLLNDIIEGLRVLGIEYKTDKMKIKELEEQLRLINNSNRGFQFDLSKLNQE